MVGTIVPVGHGQAGKLREGDVLACHVLGYVAGGSAAGYLFASMGTMLRRAWLPDGPYKFISLLVGVVYLVAGAREVGLLKFAVPQSSCQVPQWWVHVLGLRMGAFAYGGVLGCGVFVRMVGVGLYCIGLWVLLMANLRWGVLLWTGYALGRAMPVVGMWCVTFKGELSRSRWKAELHPFRSLVLVVNGMLLVGLGGLLITATLL